MRSIIVCAFLCSMSLHVSFLTSSCNEKVAVPLTKGTVKYKIEQTPTYVETLPADQYIYISFSSEKEEIREEVEGVFTFAFQRKNASGATMTAYFKNEEGAFQLDDSIQIMKGLNKLLSDSFEMKYKFDFVDFPEEKKNILGYKCTKTIAEVDHPPDNVITYYIAKHITPESASFFSVLNRLGGFPLHIIYESPGTTLSYTAVEVYDFPLFFNDKIDSLLSERAFYSKMRNIKQVHSGLKFTGVFFLFAL